MNVGNTQDLLMDAIKVALVQSAPVGLNLRKTLDKVRHQALEAKSHGARLILFPEAYISGYPKGADFALLCGLRGERGREEFRRYWESAIAVPGAETEELASLAAECNAYLVIGVVEKDMGTLYCSVLFFGADGQYLGKRRKLMPTALERVLWGQGDGSTLTVFKTDIGRLGAAICWENYMPLLRMHLYSQGIQIYCAPTVDDRDQWLASMRHIALEGRCFVLSCCQYATRRDFPSQEHLRINLEEGPLIRGGSCVVNPLGEIIAGPVYHEETILFANLNLAEIIQGKFDLDVAGHYARPDIFRLMVNEKPHGAITALPHEAESITSIFPS